MRRSIENQKIWRRITALESKIESTMAEVESNGYAANVFGSYDRVDVTNELIAEYERLVAESPEDIDGRYRFAGALFRAARLDAARKMYSSIAEANSAALLMLATIELRLGDREKAEELLTEYNQRCVEEGMPFMQSSIEKIAMPLAR